MIGIGKFIGDGMTVKGAGERKTDEKQYYYR